MQKPTMEDVFAQYSEDELRSILKEAKRLHTLYKGCLDQNFAVKFMLGIADDAINNLPQSIKDSFSCKKGCAHCCHIRVSATMPEAELAVYYANEHAIKIDTERLRNQSVLDEISYMFSEHKRCVFLDENNTCKIYEVRPMACRTYFVSSPPEDCDTDVNPHGHVSASMLMEASLPAVAIMMDDNPPDNFAAQLLKAINKNKQI